MKTYLQKRNNNYDLFDAFDDFFRPVFYDEKRDLRTNIKETESAYELDIEMPGYKKEQIKVALENGYLTVSATKEQKEKEEGEGKRFLRKEISESCSRSYYVGDDISQEDVKAKYDNGILTLTVPKSQPKQVSSHLIDIE
ncbi:MAG: Hsp20/alpha crystallin family protein [Candidatus Coproplasma sp.]